MREYPYEPKDIKIGYKELEDAGWECFSNYYHPDFYGNTEDRRAYYEEMWKKPDDLDDDHNGVMIVRIQDQMYDDNGGTLYSELAIPYNDIILFTNRMKAIDDYLGENIEYYKKYGRHG